MCLTPLQISYRILIRARSLCSMLSLRTFGQDITSKTADIQRLAGEQTSESTPKPDETEDLVTGAAPTVGVAEEAGIIAAEELGDKTLEEAMNA